MECAGATLSCVGGTCVVGSCGDGVLNQKTESCDDGNKASGDGCSRRCETLVGLSDGWGASHACAILSSGALKCWGANTNGQLGYGDTMARGLTAVDLAALPDVDLGTGLYATQVATGSTATCAVLQTGAVKCWGLGLAGALGLNDTDPHGSAPNQMGDFLPPVPLGQGAKGVTVGANFACALLLDGTVKCWGTNGNGQLGIEDTITIGDDPGDVIQAVILGAHGGGPAVATQISAGLGHVCAMLAPDNAIKCWGSNGFGQLGIQNTTSRGDAPGTMGDNLPLVSLGTGLMPAGVRAGATFTCVRFITGEIKCWGANNFGQLGLGNTTGRGGTVGSMGINLPFVDLGLPSGVTTQGLRVGTSHACVVLTDGSVKCWGNNTNGALGIGTTAHQGDEPNEMGPYLGAVDLGSGLSALGVQASANGACAAVKTATSAAFLKCWGANGLGQLGIAQGGDRGDATGEMGDALPPTLIP